MSYATKANREAELETRKRFQEFLDPEKPDIKITSFAGTMKDDWEKITGAAATLTKPPIDPHKELVDLSYEFGGRYAPPLQLDLPLMIAGMSAGALSDNAKLAIHKALNILATEHNIKLLYNTGEGGVLKHEIEDRNYFLMAQVASGRFAVSLETLLQADAIEIKISQGAKPGMGGLLLGEKVNESIAERRRIPLGVPAYSPARNMDIIGPEDVFSSIQQYRIITGGKTPIGIKIAATNVYYDAIIASRMADFITVDGMPATTGARPEFASFLGIPTIPAIVEASKGIDTMVSDLYTELRKNPSLFTGR
tara:strand:- start:1281 stop:2207 length:927 start_codon:yes stop_codon:yes gene_type:complete